MSRADNVMQVEQGVIQPRRGHWVGSSSFGGDSDRAWAITEFNGGLVIHYGPGDAGNPLGDTIAVATTPTGSWVDQSGTFSAADPEEQRLKFAQLTKSLYWNSSTGLYGLTGVSGTARLAGPAQPADFNTSGIGLNLASNAAGTWMPVNSAVGYRAVIGRKDANGVVKYGAPGGRRVVVNPRDLVVPIGGLVRVSNVVTATPTLATGQTLGFKLNDDFTLSPGEATFAAGAYIITGVTATTFTFSSTAANSTSTVAQTISSGTKAVAAVVPLPTGMGTLAGDFVQLYKTDPSATDTTDPGDEERLCYERTLTGADVSSQLVSIVDSTPTAFLGEYLYTNSNTGQGIDFAHTTPPLMNDMCVFDGRMFGAQTQGPHQLSARLLGVGSPYGLQTGDKIAVDGIVENVGATTEFAPTQNIQLTAATIAYFWNMNADGGNTLHVAQIANGVIPSGQLVFTRRNLTLDKFYFGSSRASAWQDPVGVVIAADLVRTSGSIVTVTTATAHGYSVGQTFMLACQGTVDANFPVGIKTAITGTTGSTIVYTESGTNASDSGLYYVYGTSFSSERLTKQVRFSEPEQPEAWPIVNSLSGLPDGKDVLRMMPLRGNLYIFLEHGDIYVCNESYPYSVQKFDGTATLLAPDSLIEHGGQLHALTTQGIVAISASGVEVLRPSRDIEAALRLQMIVPDSMLRAFAVAYEMDRQYQCWLGGDEEETGCSEAYVIQSDSNTAWRWVGQRTCGLSIKNTTDGEQMVFGDADSNYLRFEHKDYTRLDFLEGQETYIDPGWRLELSQPEIQLNAIHGTSASNIWAVGDNGRWLFFNGSGWTWMQALETAQDMTAVWIASGFGWAVTSVGSFWALVAGVWHFLANANVTPLYGVFGFGASDVWAVGDGGKSLYWNGVTWTSVATGTARNLKSVWGAATDNVWAVGEFGTAIQWDGATWTTVAVGPPTTTFNAVWGSAANSVWLVGDAGYTAHWNGIAWTDFPTDTAENLYSVWGISSSSVYACGANGAMIHWDGLAWNNITTDVAIDLYGIFGTSAVSFHALGAFGHGIVGPLLNTIVGGATAGTFTNSNSDWGPIVVGDLILPSGDPTKPGWVTEIDGNTLTTTSTYLSPDTFNSLSVGHAIVPLALKWMANSGGAPGIEKQWREGQLHFGQECISTATVNVTGERQKTDQPVTISPNDNPLTAAAEVLTTQRFGIPGDAQRQAMLEVEVDFGERAGQYFKLLGVSLTAEGSSEKTPKGGGA